MMRTTGSCRRLAVIGAFGLLAVLSAGEAAAQEEFSNGSCSDYELSSDSKNFTYEAGSGSFTVTWTYTPPKPGAICFDACTEEYCRTSARPSTSSSSWITIDSWASDTVSYSVTENDSTNRRSGTIYVGDTSFTVNQRGVVCELSLSTTSEDITSGGSSFNVTATSHSACKWDVSDNRSWISVGSTSVSGGDSVSVTVDPNDSPRRTGTVTIGGVNVQITQADGCAASWSSGSMEFTAGGGTQTATAGGSSACTFSVSPGQWITVDSTSVRGGGSVRVTVAASDGPAWSRNVTISYGGQSDTFSVSQADGCSSSGSTASLSFTSGSGSESATAGGASYCSFRVSDDQDWISVDSTSVSGGGSVSVSVTANDGPERTGTVRIGGARVQITQADGCSASGSTASLSFTSGAGSESATAGGSSACSFSVSDDRDWISVDLSSVSGGGTVNVSVTANTGGERTGTVTIGAASVSVTQSAAACPASPGLTPTAVTFGEDGSGDGGVAVSGSDHCSHAVTVSSGASSWLSADVASVAGGGTVTLSATVNAGIERTGTVTVGTSSVSVTQSAAACSVELTPTAVAFEADGSGAGGVTVSGAAHCSHAVTVAGGASSWLSADVTEVDGGGTVTLSATANVGDERTGTVMVGAGVVTVTQWGVTCPAAPTVTPEVVSHARAGGSTPVAVRGSSTCEYTVSSVETWVTLGSAQVSGGGTVTVTVAEDVDGAGVRRGTVTIGESGLRVAQGNTTPVAAADAVTAWRETETPVPVLDNDTDADGDPLSVTSVVTGPSNGTAVVNADGLSVTYASAAGWSGVDTFTYQVMDGVGGSADATVTVTVRAATPFTDPVLTAGETPIKAVHMTELRTRANAVRVGCGLAVATWTDPALTAGVTPIKAAHMTELRTAVTAAYAACAQTAPVWTDPVLTAGTTPIKAAHMLELREAVIALE